MYRPHKKVAQPARGDLPQPCPEPLPFLFRNNQTHIPDRRKLDRVPYQVEQDLLKTIGIRGRQKILWQLVVAVIVAVYVQNHFNFNGLRVPFYGDWTLTDTIWLPLLDRTITVGGIVFIVVVIAVSIALSLLFPKPDQEAPSPHGD